VNAAGETEGRAQAGGGREAPGRDEHSAGAGETLWPLVSVVMPTRGRPELVRQSIAAVVAQTYPGDIECIVVHDQEEPDQDLTRLGTPRRPVLVVANTCAPGLAGARNTGLGVARGDYIASCDDDDVWHPAKLESQIARLRDEPDLLAVGSGIRLLLPGNKVQDWPGRAERISYQLLLRNRVKELHSSTLVMRRDTFAKVGRYDEELPYGYAEDYDWVLRMAKAGGVGLVTQPLADIRKDSSSWYRGGGAEKTAIGLEYLLAKHPDIATSRRGHARVLGQIAFARSSLGDRGPALRYALRGLVSWPASPHPYIALVHTVTRIHPRHVQRAARLFRRGMA
jgi:glycosyltransferase involved in cell wall biosynthesis